MKTNTARQLQSESNVRKETFKMADSFVSLPTLSAASGGEKVIIYLNSLLANEFALFTKTLNFHWNITGPRFHSLHGFLGEQYQDLLKVVDGVAERIRELGGNPMGTLTELKKSSSLVEHPGEYPKTNDMIADLVKGHESIEIQIKAILSGISNDENDPGSEDFLSSLLKRHEEMAWKLKSHIEM